jgi:hypothetical protein
MKLYKALKLKKSLLGEISKLKEQIRSKNSYLEGSVNTEKYSVEVLYAKLWKKIDTLINLKIAINEANHDIQAIIYKLSEYKALIAFWNEVPVTEGIQAISYAEALRNYKVQFDEKKVSELVNEFQKRVDALQEEIDMYNYTTEFPWVDDVPVEPEK